MICSKQQSPRQAVAEAAEAILSRLSYNPKQVASGIYEVEVLLDGEFYGTFDKDGLNGFIDYIKRHGSLPERSRKRYLLDAYSSDSREFKRHSSGSSVEVVDEEEKEEEEWSDPFEEGAQYTSQVFDDEAEVSGDDEEAEEETDSYVEVDNINTEFENEASTNEENEDKNNPTQTDVGTWFVEKFKKDFLTTRSQKRSGLEAYHFNGRYYEFDDNRMILKTYLRDKFIPYLRIRFEDDEYGEDKVEKVIKMIGTRATKMAVLDEICDLLYVKNPCFDENPKYFPFSNKVYDLDKECFIPPSPDQRISLTTGYNYEKPTPEQMEAFLNVLHSILTEEDIRDMFSMIIGRSLYGEPIDKFIVMRGDGRNGKGVLNEIVHAVFGNFAYIAPATLIQRSMKDGADVTRSQLDKIRYTTVREPQHNRPLYWDNLKELTGSSWINARSVNSTKTRVKINHTFSLECNTLPDLNLDRVKESDEARIIDIPFNSTFVEDPTRVNHSKKIFLMNPYYRTQKFQNFVRCAAFDYFCASLKRFKMQYQSNFELITPRVVKERAMKILYTNPEVYTWFYDNYERVEDDDDVFVTPCKLIWNCFKTSPLYVDKPKRERLMYKEFLESLRENSRLKDCFKKTDRHVENLNRYNCSILYNVIVGYRKKQ